MKTLCKNLKAPIWHFDDGWRREVDSSLMRWIRNCTSHYIRGCWLLVLIGNCEVSLVNVHGSFLLNVALTLLTWNKQTLSLSISEEHLSFLFYATSILVWRSVLMKWTWHCYQLTCLLSDLNFMKIDQSLSHFEIFTANKEQDVLNCSHNLTKEKKDQSNVQKCTHR